MSENNFYDLYLQKDRCHQRRNEIKTTVIKMLNSEQSWHRLLHLCNVNGLFFILREVLKNNISNPNFVVLTNPHKPELKSNLLTIFGEEWVSALRGPKLHEQLLTRSFDLNEIGSLIDQCLFYNSCEIFDIVGDKDSEGYKLYEEYTRLGGEIGTIKSKLIAAATHSVGCIAYVR